MEHASHEIPDQHHGARKDFKHTYTAESIDDAEELFILAKDRLLNVNKWDKTAASASATFTLTDHTGHDVSRNAHKGDYIRINIPGPGSITGEGYDWVKIEAITYDDYPDENTESIVLQVRPAPAPINTNTDVAHFFKDEATSTFDIERHGRLLIARYYGRNEVPNTDAEKTMDVIRNTAVAAGAILGLSDAQWNSLLKGFLNFDEDEQ
jgi:hypothetical protein